MNKRLCSVLACAVLLSSAWLFAQQNTGFPMYGSFEVGPFEAVNRQNLNVNFAIPIVSVPGRGFNFNYALTYNSLIWYNNGTSWQRITGGSGTASWGWTTTGYPLGYVVYRTQAVACDTWPITWVTRYYAFVYTDGKGTNHPFPISYYQTNNCDFEPQGPYGASASDGSGLYYDPGTRILTDQSGKKIAGMVTDPNGNYSTTITNSNETDWEDTRGQVVLKVIMGTSTTTYTYKDNTGTDQTITETFTSFNIKTHFACAGVTEYTGYGVKLPTSISFPNGQQYSFTYEDTPGFSGYKTGRIQRVTLPTGGYYEYTYPTGGNNGINCSDGTVVDLT